MSDENNTQAQPATASENQGMAAGSTTPTAAPADGQVAGQAADAGAVPTPQPDQQQAAPETTAPTAAPTGEANVDTSADKEMNPPADTQQQQEAGTATADAPASQSTEPLPEFAQANPEREEVPEIIEVAERVVFEGQHIASLLRDGKELRTQDGKHITHYHCMMADGTTKHVPVELFK